MKQEHLGREAQESPGFSRGGGSQQMQSSLTVELVASRRVSAGLSRELDAAVTALAALTVAAERALAARTAGDVASTGAELSVAVDRARAVLGLDPVRGAP